MSTSPVRLVSVIVPAYNPGEYFLRTIQSICSQTYRDIEIIIVDDASSEGFRHFFQTIEALDSRIQLHRLSKNGGGGAARNYGLNLVSGTFVAFCDSDDLWPSHKLAHQISFLELTGEPMCHCDMICIDLSGKFLRSRISPDFVGLNEFLRTTALYCSSAVVRADAIESSRFGELAARHPFKFWCSMLKRGHVSYRVPSADFFYTVRDGSVSSNRAKTFLYTLFAYVFYSGGAFRGLHALLYRVVYGLRNRAFRT